MKIEEEIGHNIIYVYNIDEEIDQNIIYAYHYKK